MTKLEDEYERRLEIKQDMELIGEYQNGSESFEVILALEKIRTILKIEASRMEK